MINHHPSPDRLASFAAGSLPLSQALCISVHASQCAHCRRQLQRLDLLGAAVFSGASARGTESLKSRVLEKLDSIEAASGSSTGLNPLNSSEANPVSPVESGSSLPACLQRLIPNGLESVPWQRLSPSIHAAKLCTDVNGAQVELIKIKPGGRVAKHNHLGEEITCVLQGSFSDASGLYRQGDIIFRGEDYKDHRPIASQDIECICLTSVQAPMQFTGFFTRLLNPLIKRRHFARAH